MEQAGNHAEPVVTARGVSKTYYPYGRAMRLLLRSPVTSPVEALQTIDFDLAEGEVCVVLGANGAGKSTLFRVLTGLTTPTTGTAHVGGHSVVDSAPRIRRLIGFAPADDRTLLLRHSCTENLQFHGRMQGMRGARLARRITETLDVVGLADKRDTTGFALSSGMRARLQIARALLHEPRVLILDEPTGAIDPLGAREIIAMVRQVAHERRTAVLLSSHRLEEIEELQERVMVLDRGRVAFQGNLGRLQSTWSKPVFDLGFDDAAHRDTARDRLDSTGFAIHHTPNDELAVAADSAGDVIAALGDLAPLLSSLDQRRMTLLEVLERVMDDQSVDV